QALDGELALNDWLIAQGELTLRAIPQGPALLEDCDVDWERTRAWAGDDGAIYLNVAGREPQGIIPAAEIDQVAASLVERLRGLRLPDGAPLLEVHRPAPTYSLGRGAPPDLLVICTKAGWRPTAALGRGAIWVDTGMVAMDAAYESPTGFMVLYDP